MPTSHRYEFTPVETDASPWLAYFRHNRTQRLPIDWESTYRLTDREKATISHSIRTFQLGESSEGAHLMALSRQYAAQQGDRHWVAIVKLFIGEEQRHAHDLKRFMDTQGMAIARRHWSDSIFRRLRRLTNLEMAFTVLLTAELIATVYYSALGRATQSPTLHQLCTQIVQDEEHHVAFQSESIAQLRRAYPRWRNTLVDVALQVFIRVTAIAVWLDHRPVLQAAGYTGWSFYQAVGNALRRVQPVLGGQVIHLGPSAQIATPPQPVSTDLDDPISAQSV